MGRRAGRNLKIMTTIEEQFQKLPISENNYSQKNYRNVSETFGRGHEGARAWKAQQDTLWLRTIAVNTNGAAAKVMIFAGLGKKVRPGTFGKIKVG